MVIDEVIFIVYKKGYNKLIFRFYIWELVCLSIGYF